MRIWKIPVYWQVSDIVEIKAETLQDAIDIVKDPDFPLPLEPDYIDGSFEVGDDDEEYLRLLNE